MSSSAEAERIEQTVGRLRELWLDAADEDRPQAALMLGLAIADLVALLPDGDLRHAELAAEGTSRLDESVVSSPAVARARKLLSNHPAPSAEGAAFRLPGGNLSWDADWEVLRETLEAGRNLAAMLPMLAAALPAGLPLGQALTDIAAVIGAFDRGEWSAEGDAVLARAIRQMDADGLGSVGSMLRMVALVVRIARCRQAEKEGRQPGWPPLAEIDVVLDEMESQDLAQAFEGPFQQMAGMEYLWLACLIMMRLMADIRSPGTRRDSAWRDSTLRWISRASDYLSRVPPVYAGPVQQMRGNLARMSAELSQATMPSGPVSAPPRASPPGPATPPAQAEKPAVRIEEPPGLVAENSGAPGPLLSGPLSQLTSPQGVAGLQLLAQFIGDATTTAAAHLMVVAQAIFARRWTSDAEHELQELRQQADRLDEPAGSGPPDRAAVTAMLAMARVSKWHLMTSSPRPAERPSAGETTDLAGAVEDAIELLAEAEAESPSMAMFSDLRGVLHAEAAGLLTDLARPGGDQPDPGLIARAHEHMASVPAALLDQLPPVVSDIFLLQRIVADGIPPTPEDAGRIVSRMAEAAETTGVVLSLAEASCAAARKSQDAGSIGAALNELNKAGIALPAGSPLHFGRLILQAEMQTLLAGHTSSPGVLVDAIGAAFDALRISSAPAEKRLAAHRLVLIFSLMTVKGYREGPFEQVEDLLRSVLAEAGASDWPLRLIVTAGIGAALGMRGSAFDDRGRNEASVRYLADAERLLPEPMPDGDWYSTARVLYTWAAAHALHCPDAGVAPVALRVGGLLEDWLVRNPELVADEAAAAQELNELRTARASLSRPAEHDDGSPPGEARDARARDAKARDARARDSAELTRRSLDRYVAVFTSAGSGGARRRPLEAEGRPAAAFLREAIADLHARLEGMLTDIGLRPQLDEAIGRCAAELYWADPAARIIATLREAVVHLNRALTSGARISPSAERAELLEILARCRHEVALLHESEEERALARAEADRAARAAVRELARCVILTGETREAQEVAARANGIVARSIGWCLADGNERASVEIAEAGRGLVLASVVLAGRVEEVLRGAGRDDVADEWRRGSERGRIAALDALWHTGVGQTLLASPTADEVSIMLGTTSFDAVVYLVPPASPDGASSGGGAASEGGASSGGASSAGRVQLPGQAVLVRPLVGTIEVIPLAGLDREGREPLETYLAALDNAVTSLSQRTGSLDGFRGAHGGPEWADALVRLGRWAYDRIMAPLIGHVGRWNLGHRPHLALIPLGELAAIPYAAAWTDDGGSAGSRRYAIDDVLLTYAASARLLGEVSRRPRQALGSRVVLVSDPKGGFPMTRLAARELARRQYARAEVYGLRSAPRGPATAEVLLDALPGTNRPGASMLQVATHGTTEPVPGLRTFDGWLPLSRILDQARGRPPDAPGGLIITNACLTDSTRANYDESLTLATALLAAGATDVVGTRWPVDDDTTAVLSLRLHYHLQLGKVPAEALRCAQLDLIKSAPDIRESLGPVLAAVDQARLRHPASWAGYVHHGSDTRKSA